MFTHRHYEDVAAAIKLTRVEIIDEDGCAPVECATRLSGLNAVMFNLAHTFRIDNPRFDRARFLDACGVE